jgi:type VI secretion system secreted protein VgrG
MSDTTQQDRMMKISTPLGEDYLLINKLSASETLSELFQFNVELLRGENEASDEPTIINVKKILGKMVSIKIVQKDGATRLFNGMVNSFSQGNRDGRFSYYYATIVPSVWILTQKAQSRIFQHLSVPDILKAVFADFNIDYQIQGTFHPRNYCVQYRESDFAFASRLMEEEGLYYFFEHSNETHQMIIANTPESHPDCPSKSKLPFFLNVSPGDDFISSIATWRVDYKMQTGKVTLWDNHFELPNKALEAEKLARPDTGADAAIEFYNYPGGYAKKFDGVDRTGGAQTGEIQKIFSENKKTAEIRMQEIDAQYKVANGISDCCALTAGYRFELSKHPNKEFNTKHTLVSVMHEIEQSPDYISGDEIPSPYGNSFTCIPGSVPFRPAQKTPKPILQGSQTAMVVGPAGEEIFTDKYGRVKVRFHWHREGKNDADSSCWIRVAQGWAGKRWGMMFIPRIGMEVIVEFLEGDPDQPIITGCVYNAETMPPYKLPDEKTKMTIKSDSSTGGGGFNELRFEDKKGSEQVFIHGEKDMDVRVKNDSREYIAHERHSIVVKDKLEKVGGDKHLQVLGDKNEKISGTVSLKVEQDVQEKIGKNYALDAGTEIHLKSGTNLTIETGANLTLKVGGNFININSGGIFIKGTMVMINSGGSAGSGAGSNPEMPREPAEAAKDEFGEKVSPPPPSPPPPVFTYSPGALVMKDAAKNGTPFCEICEKLAHGNG